MWAELICGLVIYRIFRRFFSGDDDVLEVEKTGSSDLVSVANKIEKLYDGKVYTALRIPDADTGARQDIDMVLFTKGGAVVISVKNFSGIISIDKDGSWVCTAGDKPKSERHPDPNLSIGNFLNKAVNKMMEIYCQLLDLTLPRHINGFQVAEAKKQVSILESYLEQRGVTLPDGYVSFQVILANPKFCNIHSNHSPPEVITYDQWTKLKPEAKSLFSGWFKGGLRAGKKEMQESMHQQLNFVLCTAPMWDRLELKGNKYVFGEFLEFKGKHDDTQALKIIKRSKISRLIIQKFSMLGFAPSKVHLLYSPRDYRSKGASASEWNELTIRSSTEILFQPQNSTKARKFKLSSVLSMSLSA